VPCSSWSTEAANQIRYFPFRLLRARHYGLSVTSDSGGEPPSSEGPSRSYEDLGAGQQRYRVIEQCTAPETLFAKIESRQYDWLGVQEKKGHRTFILGRPPVGGSGVRATLTSKHISPDGTRPTGDHRVTVRAPLDSVPSEAWWPTPEGARADFVRQVDALKSGPGSALYRVTLIVGRHVEAEEFVVRALPNRR
jgi:hypothetical protein